MRNNDPKNDSPADTVCLDEPSDDELDASKYSPLLKEFDLTEDQERELLETLWSIMRSFVELGFDVDICGQILESFSDAASIDSEGIKSENSPTKEMPSNGNGKKTSS